MMDISMILDHDAGAVGVLPCTPAAAAAAAPPIESMIKFCRILSMGRSKQGDPRRWIVPVNQC